MLRHPIRLGLGAFALAMIAALVILPSAGAQRSASNVGTNSGETAVNGPTFHLEPYLSRAVNAVEALQQATADQQLQDFATAVQVQDYADAVNAAQAREAQAARAAEARQKASATAPGASSAPAASGGGVWDRLAACETGGRWATNSVPGYSGGLGFAHSSWAGFGGTAYAPQAWQAPREAQIAVAERILASQGWRAWPACSAKLGLR